MLNAENAKETKCRHVPALVKLIIWMRRKTVTEKSNYMLNYNSDDTENWHRALWDEVYS